jgi:signal transduction histidine kinase
MLLSSERDRVAYDLHDGTIQSLYAVSLRLGKIAHEIDTKQQEEIKKDLIQVKESLAASIVDLRGYIYDTGLNDKYLDLEGCLRDILGNLQTTTNVEITFDYVNASKNLLNTHASENICLIIQEAVTNIIKHAQATKAKVTMNITDAHIFLKIVDNGIGILHKKDTAKGTGIGMHSLSTRVSKLKGDLKIVTDVGVSIEICIPIGGLTR